ncbi:MAG: transcriptional regulator [Bacilli bacterium]|nr:transcriptional regulator [Bacilli bacterium]
MEKLEKTLKYSKLYSLYKSELSSTQQEIVNDYFLFDLSLSEIAENRQISKSAVEDALTKGMNKLDELESHFHLLERNTKIHQKLSNLKEKALNCREINEIEEIEKDLDYGI